MPILEEICDADLPELLGSFFVNVRTIKTHELYLVQSQKCLRASLNRYFKETRNIDIINDLRFIQCNSLFDSLKVKAKKEGKGVCKSTKLIVDSDMTKLGVYFLQDFKKPAVSPKKSQQCVLFYIIYFFCRRGRENLNEES